MLKQIVLILSVIAVIRAADNYGGGYGGSSGGGGGNAGGSNIMIGSGGILGSAKATAFASLQISTLDTTSIRESATSEFESMLVRLKPVTIPAFVEVASENVTLKEKEYCDEWKSETDMFFGSFHKLFASSSLHVEVDTINDDLKKLFDVVGTFKGNQDSFVDIFRLFKLTHQSLELRITTLAAKITEIINQLSMGVRVDVDVPKIAVPVIQTPAPVPQAPKINGGYGSGSNY